MAATVNSASLTINIIE